MWRWGQNRSSSSKVLLSRHAGVNILQSPLVWKTKGLPLFSSWLFGKEPWCCWEPCSTSQRWWSHSAECFPWCMRHLVMFGKDTGITSGSLHVGGWHWKLNYHNDIQTVDLGENCGDLPWFETVCVFLWSQARHLYLWTSLDLDSLPVTDAKWLICCTLCLSEIDRWFS